MPKQKAQSMPKQKIKYEPHPVSPERKKELREQGFRIIDARFKPSDADAENAPSSEPAEEIKSMKKPELQERLDAIGLSVEGKVDQLRDRLKKAMEG